MILFFMAYFLTSIVLAHPGPMDKNGCHINSDNGRKHCHKIKEVQAKPLPEKSQLPANKKEKKNSQKSSFLKKVGKLQNSKGYSYPIECSTTGNSSKREIVV